MLEVVVAAEPLAAEPRRRNLAVLGGGEVLLLHGLEEPEALLDACPQLRERRLRVRMRRRLLVAEVRGRVLRLIAARLDLLAEIELIGREARVHEHVDLERAR